MALLRPQLVRPRIALGAGLALLLATGLVFSSFSATSAQSPKSRNSFYLGGGSQLQLVYT